MEDILDAALDSLDMLSTVTNARKEYLAEMRIRGVRSLTCGPCTSTSRRHDTPTPTKENLVNQLERTVLYCAQGSSKMYFRRQKYRPTPYDLSKRKPLNSLLNPMGTSPGRGACASTSSSRSRSSDSYSDNRTGRDLRDTLPLLFEDHNFEVDLDVGLNYHYCYEHQHCHHQNQGNKTEDFPIPLCSNSKLVKRSKSLEDLREKDTHSGNRKQVRFQIPGHLHHHQDDSSNLSNSNGSFGSSGSQIVAFESNSNHSNFEGSNSASISTLSTISTHSPAPATSPFEPRTSFFNVLKGEANIKSEIESMSMLIEKLDVA